MSIKQAILIIEDDSSNSLGIKELLDQEYNIIHCPKGLKVLELISEHNPEVILLNIITSGLDGRKICEILKNNEETRYIPIICVAKEYNKEIHIKAYEAGADDYLSMPFKEHILNRKITRHIDNYRNLKALKLQQEGLILLTNEVMQDFNQLEHLHDYTNECNEVSDINSLMKLTTSHFDKYFHLTIVSRIQTIQHIHYYSGEKVKISGLDKDVIEAQRKEGIHEFGTRTLISRQDISFLSKNIPNCDTPEKIARIKKYMSMIANILAQRVMQLNQQEKKQILVTNAKDLFVKIQKIFQHTSHQNHQAILQMNETLESSFHRMQLSDEDEETIQNITEWAVEQSDKNNETNLLINKKLEQFVSQIDDLA